MRNELVRNLWALGHSEVLGVLLPLGQLRKKNSCCA